ncbi:OLC1v1005876C1 [Oldenlandia corymbosa var. corymbosa]|uniref:OLC1v1005876C1 n=1 Tax=Oldenlandia corymbosa var. corymbosa TaxID=529605 RepID=A0AAV1DHN9_OLDCO|nr:OLC1v1005876C1 [Oldenlandia corymbosa var. corymbosa]
MAGKKKAKKAEMEIPDSEEDRGIAKKGKSGPKKKKKKAKEHVEQLQRLAEKDPEFYEYLKQTNEDLLHFDATEFDDDAETDVDSEEIEEDDAETDIDSEEIEEGDAESDVDSEEIEEGDAETEVGSEEIEEDDAEDESQTGVGDFESEEDGSFKNVITTAMVNSWCKSIQEKTSLGAVRSLMKAFRIACHYGDEGGDDSVHKLGVMSSKVFNQVMLFVLTEMDGILRGLLKLSHSGTNKETVLKLMKTKLWKNHSHLVQSYLGNSLHILNQMTDTTMVTFTLRRLTYSSVLLAAFPALLRKYVKVAVHFWGTGGGNLSAVALLFLMNLCVNFGSDCIDDCFKGLYKAYVLNSQYVTETKLQDIQFLRNCFTKLLKVDLGAAYQHAFIFIRQLAMILNENFARRKKNNSLKEIFRKVYSWKFMNCLELWTGAVCAYSSEGHLKPLAYPLAQIITGTARLVPTAQYFPLRLWCIRMLNRIAASTDTFIPVAILLLDMLDIKELHRPPTGGIGEAVDFRTVLKVKKSALKTRAFQEACVSSVIEELTEHLAKWSYSAAFYELSFVPAVRLQKFSKSTKVERFRKEIKQLIHQIEANCEFTNKKRMSVSYLPNDQEAASFLEVEKKMGCSPLSQYAAVLRQKSQQLSDSITKSSVIVSEKTSMFSDKIVDEEEKEEDKIAAKEEGASIFSSSWLPGSDSKASNSKREKEKEKKNNNKKRKRTQEEEAAADEDVVEDLILSSDEDEEDEGGDTRDFLQDEDDDEEKPVTTKKMSKKQDPSAGLSGQPNKKSKFHARKSKNKKRRN